MSGPAERWGLCLSGLRHAVPQHPFYRGAYVYQFNPVLWHAKHAGQH